MMNAQNFDENFRSSDSKLSKDENSKANKVKMIKNIDFTWTKKNSSTQNMDDVKKEFSKDSSIVRRVTS